MYRICGILFLSIALAISSTACANTNKDGVTTKGAKPTNNIKAQAYPSSNEKASQEIKKEISKVKGIKKATVIVHNEDAIIGLDVNKAKDKEAIEQNVKNVVEKSSPNMRVHVTAEKEYHARIQRIHTNMVPLDGHPVSNFSEDVGILIEDIGNFVRNP
jgi:YhcN/YlaJ family sporulation lipoprotein